MKGGSKVARNETQRQAALLEQPMHYLYVDKHLFNHNQQLIFSYQSQILLSESKFNQGFQKQKIEIGWIAAICELVQYYYYLYAKSSTNIPFKRYILLDTIFKQYYIGSGGGSNQQQQNQSKEVYQHHYTESYNQFNVMNQLDSATIAPVPDCQIKSQGAFSVNLSSASSPSQAQSSHIHQQQQESFFSANTLLQMSRANIGGGVSLNSKMQPMISSSADCSHGTSAPGVPSANLMNFQLAINHQLTAAVKQEQSLNLAGPSVNNSEQLSITSLDGAKVESNLWSSKNQVVTAPYNVQHQQYLAHCHQAGLNAAAATNQQALTDATKILQIRNQARSQSFQVFNPLIVAPPSFTNSENILHSADNNSEKSAAASPQIIQSRPKLMTQSSHQNDFSQSSRGGVNDLQQKQLLKPAISSQLQQQLQPQSRPFISIPHPSHHQKQKKGGPSFVNGEQIVIDSASQSEGSVNTNNEKSFQSTSFIGYQGIKPPVVNNSASNSFFGNAAASFISLSKTHQQQHFGASTTLVLRPQHFKLHKLKNTNLRYEVIYKNLLRDFRKFYVLDFNQTTEYIKKKRRQEPRFYVHCLRQYLIDKQISIETPKASTQSSPSSENKDTLFGDKEAGIQALIFAMGSLVYPKEMLKEYADAQVLALSPSSSHQYSTSANSSTGNLFGQAAPASVAQTLANQKASNNENSVGSGGGDKFFDMEFQDFQNYLAQNPMSGSDSPKSIKARQIIDVYHYLYRFSVERLHAFVSDTAMVTLFKYYFTTQGAKRIMKSSTMKKYKDAYVEAGERITESLYVARTGVSAQGQNTNKQQQNLSAIQTSSPSNSNQIPALNGQMDILAQSYGHNSNSSFLNNLQAKAALIPQFQSAASGVQQLNNIQNGGALQPQAFSNTFSQQLNLSMYQPSTLQMQLPMGMNQGYLSQQPHQYLNGAATCFQTQNTPLQSTGVVVPNGAPIQQQQLSVQQQQSFNDSANKFRLNLFPTYSNGQQQMQQQAQPALLIPQFQFGNTQQQFQQKLSANQIQAQSISQQLNQSPLQLTSASANNSSFNALYQIPHLGAPTTTSPSGKSTFANGLLPFSNVQQQLLQQQPQVALLTASSGRSSPQTGGAFEQNQTGASAQFAHQSTTAGSLLVAKSNVGGGLYSFHQSAIAAPANKQCVNIFGAPNGSMQQQPIQPLLQSIMPASNQMSINPNNAINGNIPQMVMPMMNGNFQQVMRTGLTGASNQQLSANNSTAQFGLLPPPQLQQQTSPLPPHQTLAAMQPGSTLMNLATPNQSAAQQQQTVSCAKF